MKELSLLIDESGDFGETRNVRDYYLVTFVFHDQSKDTSSEIQRLEESMRLLKHSIEYIHTGPIIRKEDIFESYSLDERRKMIYTIFNFAIKCPVQYYTIAIKRKEASDRVQLSGKLGKAINQMLTDHRDFIDSFDKVIVYYDGGQKELSSIPMGLKTPRPVITTSLLLIITTRNTEVDPTVRSRVCFYHIEN